MSYVSRKILRKTLLYDFFSSLEVRFVCTFVFDLCEWATTTTNFVSFCLSFYKQLSSWSIFLLGTKMYELEGYNIREELSKFSKNTSQAVQGYFLGGVLYISFNLAATVFVSVGWNSVKNAVEHCSVNLSWSSVVFKLIITTYELWPMYESAFQTWNFVCEKEATPRTKNEILRPKGSTTKKFVGRKWFLFFQTSIISS